MIEQIGRLGIDGERGFQLRFGLVQLARLLQRDSQCSVRRCIGWLQLHGHSQSGHRSPRLVELQKGKAKIEVTGKRRRV